MGAERAPTRTRDMIVPTVPKTCFAAGVSTAFLFSISILSLMCDTLALRVRVAITLDVRAVESREYWWLYGGDW